MDVQFGEEVVKPSAPAPARSAWQPLKTLAVVTLSCVGLISLDRGARVIQRRRCIRCLAGRFTAQELAENSSASPLQFLTAVIFPLYITLQACTQGPGCVDKIKRFPGWSTAHSLSSV